MAKKNMGCACGNPDAADIDHGVEECFYREPGGEEGNGSIEDEPATEVVDPDSAEAPITALATRDKNDITTLPDEGELSMVERVMYENNFKGLTKRQRWIVLKRLCDEMGVPIWKQPYAWAPLGPDKSLVPVATKGLHQALRQRDKVSVRVENMQFFRDQQVFTVTVTASTPDGRMDMDFGVVGVPPTLKGAVLADRMMACITKAKNRVTNSLCGGGNNISVEEAADVSRQMRHDAASQLSAQAGSIEMRVIESTPSTHVNTKVAADVAPNEVVATEEVVLEEPPESMPKIKGVGVPRAQASPAAQAPKPRNAPRGPAKAPVRARG